MILKTLLKNKPLMQPPLSSKHYTEKVLLFPFRALTVSITVISARISEYNSNRKESG